MQKLWQEHTHSSDAENVWSAGGLTCHYRRTEDEWAIRSEYTDTPQGLKDVEWHRWAFNKAPKTLRIVPMMPDRPLVVRTLTPVSLPAGAAVCFYISIPVVARFTVSEGKIETVIATLPTIPLANTWYGIPHGSGVLSYAIKSRARLKIENTDQQAHRAICPFFVRNRDKEPLLIEGFSLQGRFLNIYQSGELLQTSAVKVEYRGKEYTPHIEYPRKPDKLAGRPSPTLLNKAENEPDNSLLSRTLHYFPFTTEFK